MRVFFIQDIQIKNNKNNDHFIIQNTKFRCSELVI